MPSRAWGGGNPRRYWPYLPIVPLPLPTPQPTDLHVQQQARPASMPDVPGVPIFVAAPTPWLGGRRGDDALDVGQRRGAAGRGPAAGGGVLLPPPDPLSRLLLPLRGPVLGSGGGPLEGARHQGHLM